MSEIDNKLDFRTGFDSVVLAATDSKRIKGGGGAPPLSRRSPEVRRIALTVRLKSWISASSSMTETPKRVKELWVRYEINLARCH